MVPSLRIQENTWRLNYGEITAFERASRQGPLDDAWTNPLLNISLARKRTFKRGKASLIVGCAATAGFCAKSLSPTGRSEGCSYAIRPRHTPTGGFDEWTNGIAWWRAGCAGCPCIVRCWIVAWAAIRANLRDKAQYKQKAGKRQVKTNDAAIRSAILDIPVSSYGRHLFGSTAGSTSSCLWAFAVRYHKVQRACWIRLCLALSL